MTDNERKLDNLYADTLETYLRNNHEKLSDATKIALKYAIAHLRNNNIIEKEEN